MDDKEAQHERDLARRTRKFYNLTVILPEGERWMDECLPGQSGWDVVDDVLQKGTLGKKGMTWKEVEKIWKADDEREEMQRAIDHAAAQEREEKEKVI